jgi:carotenoid cleavage dioxygenase
MDLPVTFNLEKAMSGGAPIGWDESYGARIGIMPRMGTNADIRWFEIDPCYVFHPMNAFVDPHDSNKVVCDVGRHEYMWRDSMDDFPPSYLHRWTFDMVSGAVTETQLDDVAHGFPRVDERRVGLPNRYGWVVAERPGGEGLIDDPSVVVKYDLEKGTSSSHDLGPHAHPGEFVFAPASESAGEDEGFVMGFVYDQSSDSSDLVILDASNMKAPPVARIHLPQRVPYGFHGSWLPTS